MKEGDCKHYTGSNNQTCGLGINYRQLVGGEKFGWGLKLPCIPSSPLRANHPGLEMVTCDRFEATTAEDFQRQEAEFAKHLNAIAEGKSSCCGAPLDETQVIRKRGRMNGHGPRFCSKCRKVVFYV